MIYALHIAFEAFISMLVDRTYTVTRRIVISIGTAGRTTLAASSGALVDWLNETGDIFIITAIMVIPSHYFFTC